MSEVIETLGKGFEQAFLMAYEVWWALVLGFAISAMVQAWVPRHRIESALSGSGFGPVSKATGLGAASSSCSYAAIAIARSLFEKGASAATALAFQFASTNLVWELGLVLWVLIGWQFALAEYVGGIVLIALMSVLLRRFVSPRLEERAREHARHAAADHQHRAAGVEGLSWRERLTSPSAWSDVAHNFRGDWEMLWKEITVGFLLAGFIGPQLARSTADLLGTRFVASFLCIPLLAVMSMGLMLENVSPRLRGRGEVHQWAPDKEPAVRLRMLREAGELRIPFTTGILIGIGETPEERVDTLLAIRDLHRAHGHIQEVIVQNFRAKPTIPRADAPEPDALDMARTIAVARLVLDSEVSVQAPPNLSPEDHLLFIAAGLNDWGGISPLTPDYVNPEAPWPHVAALAETCAAAGFALRPRLPIYPAFVEQPGFLAPELGARIAAHGGAEVHPS